MLISIVMTPVYMNIVMYKVSIFFHILAKISCFLRIVILIGVRWNIKSVIILISLMI